MMEVGSSTNYGLPVGSTSAATDIAQAKKIDAGQMVNKDQFLQLMIAQLKNQDPLDPIKNEDYIAQLATFSSLEQLIEIKEGINKLADATTTTGSNPTAENKG